MRQLPAVRFLAERPVLAGVIGSLCLVCSPIFVRLADTPPATAAFFRCAYALPVLGLLVLAERRRLGPLPARTQRLAALAGAFLAVDLVLWHRSIALVGAGLGSVLGNLQVVVVPFAAWALFAERPGRRIAMAVPVVLVGVVLVSGLLSGDGYGQDPVLGSVYGIATSLAYAAFLLTLRHGTRGLQQVAGPLLTATSAAAAVSAVLGAGLGELDLAVSWPAHGWLLGLALTSQVVGWLFLSVSLPRLAAALSAVLLLLQPVFSVAIGAAVLNERPSATQLLGAGVVLGGVVLATVRRPVAPARPLAPVPVAAATGP